jgi:hypothetical protein
MFKQLKPFQAPRAFVFTDPDTNFRFRAKTKKELIQRIVAYRDQNNLEPLEELGIVLENYWCSLPRNQGRCEPVKELKRGVMGYLKGGFVLAKNLWYGDKNMVSPKEADRRGVICLTCIHNRFPDKKAYQRWADEIAVHSIGKKRSTYHDALGNCEVCSCPLRAKVWYGGEITLTKQERRQMQKVNCWQIEAERTQKTKASGDDLTLEEAHG